MSCRRLARPLVLALLLLTSAHDPAAAQCAMCRSALTSSAEGAALQGPLNRAILVLLAAPYLVLGCFLLLVWRERNAQRARVDR
jgi:hypothetical protein